MDQTIRHESLGTLKARCQPTDQEYYTADFGNGVPVRLFLTEKLFNEADPGLWAQIRNAAAFPRTQEVYSTPK